MCVVLSNLITIKGKRLVKVHDLDAILMLQ